MRFRTIKEAMEEAGVSYKQNSPEALLVWFDGLKDWDYYSPLRPWQIVNRIPNINVLCRKVPFTRLINGINQYFPEYYKFMPKAFAIPQNKEEFLEEIAKTDSRYIYKPDCGSLGCGIKLIEPKSQPVINDDLAVIQEYIEPFLVDNTKFDLRIYALVTNVNPLKIFVYHDGLARFCSLEYNTDSLYSHLTNVTMNRNNPEMDIIRISRLISELFPRLAAQGIDTNLLWKKIEDVIALTIFPSLKFISLGEEYQLPSYGYSRCFQILGFDILLDKNLDPHVLEVNYRPSLDYYRGVERRMKVDMIRDAILLATSYPSIQQAIKARNDWSVDSWKVFMLTHGEYLREGTYNRKKILSKSKYCAVWPSKDPDRQAWVNIITKIKHLPFESMPGYKTYHLFINNDNETDELSMQCPKY